MNILFVVCGEGLGHASRTVELAKYLEKHDFSCHIATYGKSYEFVKRQGISHIHRVTREVTLDGECGFFSLSKTLWASKGVVLNLLHSMNEVRQLIRLHNIDLVIADTMYAAVPAAKLEKVHAFFMTNQNRFSTAKDGDSLLWRPLWRLLSFVVESYLTIPDAVIIPDFAPPDTISGYNISTNEKNKMKYHFVGPITELERDIYQVSDETIFASFGGEPFKVPLYGLLKNIADRRCELSFEVFSTAPGLPEQGDNFRTFGYVPDLHEYLAQAKVAILHGGLTTLQEALFFGKPVVMIIDPSHPEQWNNARKIMDLNAGVLVDGRDLTEETLESALDTALSMTPPDFSAQFASQNGRDKTLKLIEQFVETDIRKPACPEGTDLRPSNH